MIELYFAPTPNGWKISIMLEECGLPYELHRLHLDRGEQFDPTFLAISPNNRIPAIVDLDPKDGEGSMALFESGAILLYLADKVGRFMPSQPRHRSAVAQWLFWQVGGLGPMLGQHAHFKLYAAEHIPYAIGRYAAETHRLYRVLDGELGRTGAFVAGAYSVADIACFPWIITHKAQGITLDDYPNIKRWFEVIRSRPQVQAGLAVGGGIHALKAPDDEARAHLFGQRALATEVGEEEE